MGFYRDESVQVSNHSRITNWWSTEKHRNFKLFWNQLFPLSCSIEHMAIIVKMIDFISTGFYCRFYYFCVYVSIALLEHFCEIDCFSRFWRINHDSVIMFSHASRIASSNIRRRRPHLFVDESLSRSKCRRGFPLNFHPLPPSNTYSPCQGTYSLMTITKSMMVLNYGPYTAMEQTWRARLKFIWSEWTKWNTCWFWVSWCCKPWPLFALNKMVPFSIKQRCPVFQNPTSPPMTS